MEAARPALSMPIRPSGSWGAVGGEFGLGARPGPNPPMAWLGYLCRSSQAAIASYFGGHRAIAGQRAVAAAARLPKRRALRAQHEIGTPELFYSAAAAHTAHARGAHATALAQGQPVVREARDGQCGHRPCPYRAQIPHSAAAAPSPRFLLPEAGICGGICSTPSGTVLRSTRPVRVPQSRSSIVARSHKLGWP